MAKSSSVELSPLLALLALSQRHIQNVVHFPFLTQLWLWTWGRGAEELVASSMCMLAKEGINLRVSKWLYNDCRCGRRLAESPETAASPLAARR